MSLSDVAAVSNSPLFEYRYSALNIDVGEIRLVKIHPGLRHEHMKCTLLHTQLKDAPSYEALSYTWGETALCRLIRLGGAYLRITENLRDALFDIRSISSERNMWIDAICIDQSNLAERNSQVRYMRDIFGRAAIVRVWLKWEGGDLERAFGFATELAKYYRSMQRSDHVGHKSPEKIVDINSRENWEALYSLMSVRWWGRVWVVQEVVVASKVIVVSARCEIRWSMLQQALIVARNYSAMCATRWPQIDVVGSCGSKVDVMDSFPDARTGRGASLLELLTENKGKNASDARDMVFALLGISVDSHPDSFQPDYSKSVRQVYKETVKDVVAREGNLAILAYAGGLRNKSDFPTWVVDWRATAAPTSTIPIWTLSQKISRLEYGGHVSAAGNTSMVLCFKHDLECLELRGCYVDQIWRVGGLIRSTNLKSNIAEANAMKNEQSGQYPTGEDQATAFCQVMRIGSWFSAPLEPPTFKDESLIWLKACAGKSFATTLHGYMALVPSGTREDDSVVVVAGCPVPLIIRRNIEDHNIVVGAAYGTFYRPTFRAPFD
jgi:Heterokaryon incompatibility protein (HET)